VQARPKSQKRARLQVARRSSGEAEEIEDQAIEVHDRIVETHATSLAGLLGQLTLLREEAGGDFDELVDSITAGVKHIVGSQPEPRQP
jgi:hypothetical protein